MKANQKPSEFHERQLRPTKIKPAKAKGNQRLA